MELNGGKMKKKNKKWIYGTIIVIILFITYFSFFGRPGVSGKGLLKLTNDFYDFGTVSMKKGTVSAEIPFVNIGEGDLTITSLDTSCGCTTASIVNKGTESPIFQMAMHGRNPRNWKTIVKPGEEAVLKVYYDPNVHPDLRGPVTRIVAIISNDPIKPVQQVRIKVNQVE